MGHIKNTKAASERLLQLNWRGEDEHDSTRNPVVEAHDKMLLEDAATQVADEAQGAAVPTNLAKRPQTQANQSLAKRRQQEVDLEIADLYAEAPADEAEAPELVAEPQLTTSEKITKKVSRLSEPQANASIRLDEVMAQITPYAAMQELEVSGSSLLGRTMLANANAVLSTLFLNLQADYGYTNIFTQGLGAVEEDCDDVTDLAINEVLRLQGLKTRAAA